MRKGLLLIIAGLVVVLAFAPCAWSKAKVIKVGINAPITGDIPKVGEGSKFAAQMWLEDIKAAGGLEVGGTKYPVEIVVEDNESKAESAVKVNTKMILAAVGVIAILVILVLTDVIGLEDTSDDFDVNMVEMAASDEDAWASAESLDTYKGYLDYFSKYYDDGIYKQQASDRMDELANTTGVAQYSQG